MVKVKERDRFGHCVRCHKLMMREVAINGEVKLVPTAENDRLTFLLDNGSQMGVAICRSCKHDVTEADFEYIMQAVIDGWDWETTQLVNDKDNIKWDEAKKKEYMDVHRQLNIVVKSEGLSVQEKNKRLKEFRDKKVKPRGNE